MIRFSLLLLGMLAVTVLSAQPPATPAGHRLKAYDTRQQLHQKSPVSSIEFTSIGPTVFSGRVSDIAVNPEDPSHFYVAYSSGGLWYTNNNGTSFTPIFDKGAVHTTGAVAVDWKTNTIWLGTGEVNSSRSSYAGTGVYKSTDGGESWEHMGLAETHHIGRIVLHPADPNTAWVAALGHLYSSNEERGVYRTTDGGKTWQKTLYINDKTGAVDLVIDPQTPTTLYAATWQRERFAWNFVESGPGSGIWKSIDGGQNWSRISDANTGFPNGEGVGRIGLALRHTDQGTVVYANLDNYFRRPPEDNKEDELTKDQLRTMSVEAFVKLPVWKVRDYLQRNNFPGKYRPEQVIDMVKKGEIKTTDLVRYTEDANSLLFDTPVIGLEVYKLAPGSNQWQRTHEDYLDGIVYSYGYYFGQIRTSPHHPGRLYTMGVPILRSDDDGKTWKGINGANVHGDHHALWINPKREGHLILGNDGGINISYDAGETWIKCNTPAVGQFYAVAVDNDQPYNVYGGLQDNGVWAGAHTYQSSTGWHGSGQYGYKFLLGGDGMQVAVDPRDNVTVYTGFQFGNYFRLNRQTGARKYITPKHELGEEPLRWNWQTPIHLSVHQPDILYMGANRVYRSFNQGDDWTAISGDLTHGGLRGDVPYGTLTDLHESPRQFGLLYTGSDDGRVHISRDAGTSWQDISAGLPTQLWVSRVQASGFADGRVYVALNGYRWDDMTAYVYRSDDYGTTWQRIGTDLPHEPVNVILEDPSNENLLYVGTDHGLYASLDRGQQFSLLGFGLPDVAVHDVVVQNRDKDLLVGTHGRSLYLGSVKELQQLTPALLAEAFVALDPAPLSYSSRWGNNPSYFSERVTPEILLPVYSSTGGTVRVEVWTKDQELTLSSFTTTVGPGLHYITYDGTVSSGQQSAYQTFLRKQQDKADKPIQLKTADNDQLYIRPGSYLIRLSKDGINKDIQLKVK